MTSAATPPPESSKAPGRPRCSNCGHDLTGAIKSSTCPECGKPLVEVLVRDDANILRLMGKRYESKAQCFGMPVISVALGPGPDGRMGKARGCIAIGDRASGFIAIGGFAFGVVSMGGCASGVFTLGGLSLGLLGACGGFAVAPLGLAVGGMAVGLIAVGGMGIGGAIVSGSGLGWYAWGGTAAIKAAHFFQGFGAPGSDPAAERAFGNLTWLLGRTAGGAIIRAAALFFIVYGALIVALGLPAVVVWQRREERESRLPPLSPPTSRGE